MSLYIEGLQTADVMLMTCLCWNWIAGKSKVYAYSGLFTILVEPAVVHEAERMGDYRPIRQIYANELLGYLMRKDLSFLMNTKTGRVLWTSI